MKKLASDQLFDILAEYSIKGEEGFFNASDSLTPTEEFLLSRRLIESRDSLPDYPDINRYVITSDGEYQLSRFNSQKMRHSFLIVSLSILSGFLFLAIGNKLALLFLSESSNLVSLALLFPCYGSIVFLDSLPNHKAFSRLKTSLVFASALLGFPILSLLLYLLLI